MKVDRIAIFNTLSEEDQIMIDSYIDKIKLGKGKVVFRQDEQADFIYYIISGSVSISERVYVAFSGQFLGLEGVFSQSKTYPIEAITDEPTTLLRVPSRFFLKLFDDDKGLPKVNGRNANLLKHLLEQTNEKLLFSVSKHQAKKGGSPGAIANLLLYHLDTGQVTLTEYGLQITKKMTEAYIAECCHCDRSTVSRTLLLFNELGIIYKAKRTKYITVISRERLNDFCLGRIRRNEHVE